jgi:hypothetical protein
LDLLGLSRAKVIRITANPDGSGPRILYKASHRDKGWFPRPCPPGCINEARRKFAHEDPNQGYVSGVKAVAFTDHGMRDQYRYTVKYFGGDVKFFDLKCPSLPFNMTREALSRRLGYATRQSYYRSHFSKLPAVRSAISRLLKARRWHGTCQSTWDQFFNYEMPQSDSDYTFQPFDPPMVRIVKDMGGAIRLPISHNHEYNVPVGPYDFVDPMTFSGGPVRDESENDRILRGLGLPLLPKKKRKKDKDDDAASDAGDNPGVPLANKKGKKKSSTSSQAKKGYRQKSVSSQQQQQQTGERLNIKSSSKKKVDRSSENEKSCEDTIKDDDSSKSDAGKKSESDGFCGAKSIKEDDADYCPGAGSMQDASMKHRMRIKRSSKQSVNYCEDDHDESGSSDDDGDSYQSENEVCRFVNENEIKSI